MASKVVGSVFQVLCPTRNYGVGARVTRKCWSKFPEPTYWEITRVHPSPDLKHGKAFGRFTFRGASHSDMRLSFHWHCSTCVERSALSAVSMLRLPCSCCQAHD